MKKITLFIIFIILLPSWPVHAQQEKPEKIHIHTVIQQPEEADPVLGGLPLNVYFSAIGTNGQPLSNVSFAEETTRLVVDGVPFDATISKPLDPFYVTFVLDVSNSMNDYKDELVDAVELALEAKPDEARISLRLFHADNWEAQSFTDEDYFLTDVLNDVQDDSDVPHTCQFDALNEALITLSKQPASGRRAIVFLTDGQERAGNVCTYGADQLDDITAFAVKQQTAVYPITFGNKESPHLETLAEKTGGFTFSQVSALSEKFAQIMTSLNSQWLAQATVAATNPGTHDLVLRVGLSGNDTAQTLTPGVAKFITTESYIPPTLPPRFDRGITPDYQNGRLSASILIPQAKTFNDCLNVKLLDLDTNLILKEDPVCPPLQPKHEYMFQIAELINGHTYCLELSGHPAHTLPNCGDEDSPTALIYKHLERTFEVAIDVKPIPETKQIQVRFEPLNNTLDENEWLEYTLKIERDGSIWYEEKDGRLNSYKEPIPVEKYPTNGKADQTYNFSVTAVTANGRTAFAQKDDVVLQTLPDSGLIQNILNAFTARPILLAAVLLVLVLPILYLARRNLTARRASGTGHLAKSGVYSSVTEPPSSVTRIPENRSMPSPLEAPATNTVSSLPTPSPTPIALLTIISAPNKAQFNQTIPITTLPFRIGREDSDLNIGDGRISRRHAVITAIDNTFYIEDLKSTNGTFLDDRNSRLTPSIGWPLNTDTLIRLGDSVEILFQQTE